jgi:hypothetical protein
MPIYNKESSIHKYRLLGEERKRGLVIEVIGQRFHVIRRAKEILADKAFLQGFAPADIACINIVAKTGDL